jgi:ATP-dependent helicase/nuclease subunit B
MAILEHLIQSDADVTVSLNCDQIGSRLFAFEKAGNTARELRQMAEKAGIQFSVQIIPGRNDHLKDIREKLFQGTISGPASETVLQTFRADTPFLEAMSAVHYILGLVRKGDRYRDISVVCTDLDLYRPYLEMIFHRYNIPFYCSGTEPILQKSVISTVLLALDAAQSGFDTKSMLRYLRSALSPLDPELCDMLENYVVMWGIRGKKWTQEWQNHPEGLGYPWEESHKRYLSMLNEARSAVVEPLYNLKTGFHNAKMCRSRFLVFIGS